MLHFLLVPATIAKIMTADSTVGTYENGNHLLTSCSSRVDLEFGHCVGYIEGISDAISSIRKALNQPQCIPDGVDASQLRDVVVSYLQKHAEERHEAAAPLVTQAYREAWCNR